LGILKVNIFLQPLYKVFLTTLTITQVSNNYHARIEPEDSSAF
jgi:hypothetical protein